MAVPCPKPNEEAINATIAVTDFDTGAFTPRSPSAVRKSHLSSIPKYVL